MSRKRVDFKIREEDAAVLREIAASLNVKMADIIKLWPRCPKCGFKIVEVAGRVMCPKCLALFIVDEGAERGARSSRRI